ncbi:unnamed protein product [Sympodiomycopsis kandeliae]
MNGAAQYSGQVIDSFFADEEVSLRQEEERKRVERLPRSGRIHHPEPFGGQQPKWQMDQSESSSTDAEASFTRPISKRTQMMDQNSQRVAGSSSNAWSNHPSVASESFTFDTENQTDIKPVLGWYDENAGEKGLKQLATMQARLNQRLGPEYISQRQGAAGAGKLSYIEGWKAIDLANDVFGFNGWSTTLKWMTVDYMEVSPDGSRVHCGVSACIRISLRDGTFHEDVGWGGVDNGRGRGASLEKAKKEAVTDGIKRAMRNFGRLTGNCVYDQKYCNMIAKMTPKEEKYNPQDFHRRNDWSAPPPVTTSSETQQATSRRGPATTSSEPTSRPALAPARQQPSTTTTTPAVKTEPGNSSMSMSNWNQDPSSSRAESRSESPTKPSGSEDEERIRAERKALAEQRKAAFRARREEQDRETAAALQKQQRQTPNNANGSAAQTNGSAGPTTTTTSDAAPTTTATTSAVAGRYIPPSKLKRAPAGQIPTPTTTTGTDATSRLFAKEPGSKWSQPSKPTTTTSAGAELGMDEADLSAVVDSWNGQMSSQQQPQDDQDDQRAVLQGRSGSAGHFVSAAHLNGGSAGMKRVSSDTTSAPVRNVSNHAQQEDVNKRRRV